MVATKLQDKICPVCSNHFQGWNCNVLCSTECRITLNLSIRIRTCDKCGETKPIEEYYMNNKKTFNRTLTCRICEQKERLEFKQQNPEYHKMIDNNRKRKWGKLYPEKCTNTRLKGQYGITLDNYNEMLDKQNGTCAICNLKETKISKETGDPKRLAVDHCHETGKVRGLLCFHCNSSLGKFKDSIELLQNAIDYLKGNNDDI